MDTEMLRELGVSIPQALKLVELGWLYRLSAGAYLLTGDAPSPEGTIVFLSRRIPGLHVGSKTTLTRQGVRHNIAFRERLVLWGQTPYQFPDWVTGAKHYGDQTTRLFDDQVPYGKWPQSVPGRHPALMVSHPERAVVELVSQLGRSQSMEEVQSLMVTMRNLRKTVLEEVLEHCERVTTVRMVCKLGRARDTTGREICSCGGLVQPGRHTAMARARSTTMLAEAIGAIAAFSRGVFRRFLTAGMSWTMHGATIFVGIAAMFDEIRFARLGVGILLRWCLGLGGLSGGESSNYQ